MSKEGKQFRFEQDALSALLDGINQLTEAVAITLGPKGRNVGLQSSWGSPSITSDGHSIAQQIEFKDPFLNMGASLAKEVAAKIKEKAGDGTTTGILLLRAIVQAGVKNIAAGANPIAIKRGMDKTLEALLKEIAALSVPVKNQQEIQNIATVSASGDADVGKKIAESFEKAGKEGIITIEEGKGIETTIEAVQGMQFASGYTSPYFCTNPIKMTAEMTDCFLLITDQKIHSAQEILPLLQHVSAVGQELVIIAEEIDGDALSTLVINKLKGTLKVVALKAPSFGDARKAILEDIAILTGGEVISGEKGLLLKEATPELLGKADQILISKDTTTIVGGKGVQKEIQARIAQLQALAKNASSYEKEKLEERKGKLSGGVAVIKVGGTTESEMKKRKQLFEDSLQSTKAALEKGVVLGGGMTLLRAAKSLSKNSLSPEESVGEQILLQACTAPFRQLVLNAGFDPSLFLESILKEGKQHGFNVLTEKVEDLAKAGVLDPTKVIESSLIHAVSTGGIALLSETLIG
jgi:chaperonin GroEL